MPSRPSMSLRETGPVLKKASGFNSSGLVTCSVVDEVEHAATTSAANKPATQACRRPFITGLSISGEWLEIESSEAASAGKQDRSSIADRDARRRVDEGDA